MVDRGILPVEYSLEQLQNVVKVARACLDDNPETRLSMKEVLIALYNFESKDISSSDFSFEVGYYSPSPLLQRTMLLLLRQQHLFFMEE
jgi:hypothetical protein